GRGEALEKLDEPLLVRRRVVLAEADGGDEPAVVLNRQRHAAAWEVGRDAFDPQAFPPPLRGSPRRRRPAIEAGGVARVRLDDVLLRRGEPAPRRPPAPSRLPPAHPGPPLQTAAGPRAP